MSRVEWNKAGERTFEAGVDHCVLYPPTGGGVAWNGLVSLNENTSGGELESLYYDGVKYLDVVSAEDFQAELTAFSSPPEFAACDGVKMLSPGLFVTQQPRKTFGLSYRTLLGNDLEGTELGYKLHLVYNCTAAPTGRSNQTISASPSPGTRTWTIDTVPPAASTFRPTAHLVLDSTLIDPYVMADVESLLYGRDAVNGQLALPAYLPPIADIVAVLNNPITALIEATI